ncbi:acetate--CoA ligase family protein [Oryzicola mucosus]|uniref:Acetate--CoA ligase family protein n=1 Tax=Oryzicola mucosus TaxID=2767425 RepID=A0A8J6U0B5_9HYPH|nr:acetate--CoA ligase family protein [Oryzicola mucosus]MBD0417339.1 acetate--CoA ligase family protein [Oryzicola mucosus]
MTLPLTRHTDGTLGGLDYILSPRSIAIIGASSDENRVGGRTLRHLRQSRFDGPVYAINPSRSEVQGFKAYPHIGDVTGPVDCAVVAVPATDAVAVVRECAASGVRSVVLFSAGFAELGPSGKAAQDELSDIARTSGMRILGPNCMGAYNAGTGAYVTFANTFISGYDETRNVALVSQSGGIGSHLATIAQNRGLIFGNFVTTGNECDVEIGEVIGRFAADPSVKVIVAYIEGVRSAKNFVAALELAHSNRKPVIVLKVGQSEEGAKIASSHTASLAGFDAGYEAIFQKYGVYRARTIDEMLDVAYVCSRGVFPSTKRAAVMSLSGGAAVQIADLAVEKGLDLPAFPQEVQRKLVEISPSASTNNPTDLTANVVNRPEMFEACLELMSSDCEMVMAFVTVAIQAQGLAQPLLDAVRRVRTRNPRSVLLICGVAPPEIVREYENSGCLVFEEMARAVNALAALADISAGFSRTLEHHAADLGFLKLPVGVQLNEVDAKAVLNGIGIQTPREKVVESADVARFATESIAFPLVVKVISPDIQHKTDVGGVVLGVASAEATADAIDRISASVRRALPEARIDGYLLSEMVPKGIECIVGVTADPKFGPMIMFGLGGVAVEVFKDVTYRLAPVSRAGAMEMIRDIRGYPLLAGHRGAPAADLEALAVAIAAVSQLAARNADHIATVEINPLLVFPAGQGVMALDALIATDG